MKIGNEFKKICFLLTRSGLPTEFQFVKNSYGPYSSKVNKAITVLSNANLLTEIQLGQMIETKVSETFCFDSTLFSEKEMQMVEQIIDLLSRMKSTEQAEMMSTVIFSFDELAKQGTCPTEEEIYQYILDWKPRWKNTKDLDIILTIKDLSELKWIEPNITIGTFGKRIKKRRMEVLSFSWYTFHTLFFYTFFSFLFQSHFLWKLV